MNILYFANGPRGLVCLEAMLEAGYRPAGVVVHAGGTSNPIAALAGKSSIPVFAPKNVNDPGFVQTVSELSPGLFVLTGYARLLKSAILAIPPKGAINLHGGRLPEYRGGSPINWQIINGETVGGCSVIYVDEGVDTGDIVYQETYPITPEMTAGEATNITLGIFPRLLLKTLDGIRAGKVVRTPQNPLHGTHYCKRYPEDGRIRWETLAAKEVHNLVRGLNGDGLPGAYSHLRNEKIIIWETKLMDIEVRGIPGRIAMKRNDGVVVIARDRGILVTKVRTDHHHAGINATDFFKICGDTLT